MATAVTVTKTNNADIDGLLSGYKWTGTITYSFPDAPGDYSNPYSGGSSEPTTSGFASAPTQMQAAVNYAIGLINGYTNANVQYAGTNGADIMIAQSPSANPTSYAYYPGNYASGGDIWFGTQYDYSLAKLGNYYFATALHELGHAVGLKHSQETGGPANVAVPSAHDDSEYTVMSYRSYVGASTTGGYTNEAYGFSQTYMANDILALQTMYGANFTTQSSNTVYTWNPTTGQALINGVGQLAPGGGVGGSANRIYETVWDGGGVDTYDLSNYTTNLSINLNPGASSLFSSVQLANLGNGHYASGNVYNAYLYNGDARSYIDNAIGGSGNDTLMGNAIANALNGGGGNDTITGSGGNDVINGGSGTDTAVYSGSRANYLVSYNAATQTFTLTDQRSGVPNGTDTVTGVEYFQFADGTIASSSLVSTTIETFGSTSLVVSGGNYYLNSLSTGTGPTLKYAGNVVNTANYTTWSVIAAEQVSGGGYDVVWKDSSNAHYSVWSTDSAGNFLRTLGSAPEMLGNDAALKALEPMLQQDLNGDGTIGVPVASPVTIETFGSTSLVVSGGNYYLNSLSTGTGPTLKYAGNVVNTANYTTWSVIAAEQVSGGGYDVVWKDSSNAHYSVWSTDSAGNFLRTLGSAPEMLGNDAALKALEPMLQQDLNGDGTIGVPVASPVTIETFGSTSLVVSGGNYYLNSLSTGTGPTLKYAGNVVNTANYTTWSVIAAEQVSGGGYDVVWKDSSNAHYSVWSTDSAGNFLRTLGSAPEMLGNDAALKALEPMLQQDLNGDGTIGVPVASPVTIETFGSTSLVVSGGNYYLNSLSTGTGPTLKYAGNVVNTANYTTWSVIAAEQVSGGGYDVVWKDSSNAHYSVWSTDSAGNFLRTLGSAPEMLGNDAALKALEPMLQQDLNGDGTIGVPVASPVTIETFGSTSLVVSGGNYYLNSLSTGTGPTLKYAGNVVNTANYTTWSVIAAEQVSGGGYDVVWKDSSNAHYSVWSTDSAGNFLRTLGSAPEMLGNDAALKALEPTLHQDLNGDGAVGAAPWTNGFVFNFDQGGSSSSSSAEVPDTMPGWVGAQATSSSSAFAEAPASQDVTAQISPVDLLHALQEHGFLLR
ncbi:M10 family metallopeptidase C-terminal domain-containing protein [Bradyrhizobium sp. CCGB12]|uniref:M10 family metallopeptidase C-terminal domain-containing protein n=1 Tax=Bradyrhizobium sp. CCGB12 TaxID=2949632 RepID=UPI0020B24EB1|nr:M10 family metallopeptidase C-terminal domain-containing protein [Bradyrhizobium sp. CCGB12]MCP3388298.1 M10 family metallopeptidase C-terminal domain-containing protein [Bradyrhizobium sp. CCGB12]